MSAYRAIVGWGSLVRQSGQHAVDLPLAIVGGQVQTTYASPTTILANPNIYLDGSGGNKKWQRFGAAITCTITRTRNINYHNDIGKREYTVATTGMYEPDFTIDGMVSADNLEWLMYLLNMPTFPTPSSNTYKFEYIPPEGPKTFDMCYLQSNSKTNEYAGFDEVHIMTGCAINKATISYELGSDAGVTFSLECMALMDYASLMTNMGDVNQYLEDIPADVFSTGCVSYSLDGANWVPFAQTDKASLTIENFLERRGNCNTNWASGYSMGTLNYTAELTTYSNDPGKVELAFLGYARSDANTNTIYSVKKVPYKTPFIRIHTDNGDPTASSDADRLGNKRLDLILTDAIVDTLDKRYESEQAILDEASLRASVGYINVYTETQNWGAGYTPPAVIGRIEYNLNGGSWDVDADPTFDVTASTENSITLPTSDYVSRAGYTFTGWKETINNDGVTASDSEITIVPKSTVTGVWTANPGTPYRIIATWTANS